MNDEAIALIKSVYYPTFILLGIIINSFVIFIILKYKKLQTTTNFFILNLAITDLLFTVCGISTIFYKGIAKTSFKKEKLLCEVIGFLALLFLTTSIWTLVMISINRYFNVARPNEIKKLYTRIRTTLIIAAIWIFSVLISFPPFIGWSEFKSGSNFCTINGKKHSSYTIFLGLLNYIIPMFFLASLYMRIFFLLNKVEKNKLRRNINSTEITNPTNKTSLDKIPVELIQEEVKKELGLKNSKVIKYYSKYNNIDSIEIYENEFKIAKSSIEIANQKSSTVNFIGRKCLNAMKNQQIFAIKKHFKEVRITKKLMVLVLGFFLTWTPIFVGALLYSFDVNLEKSHLTMVGTMWVCLGCILNPLIYSVMNNSFRKCFFQIWNIIFKSIKCC